MGYRGLEFGPPGPVIRRVFHKLETEQVVNGWLRSTARATANELFFLERIDGSLHAGASHAGFQGEFSAAGPRLKRRGRFGFVPQAQSGYAAPL